MECDDKKDRCSASIENRKHYSREFLLKLQSHPLSWVPPSLPDEVIKRKKSTRNKGRTNDKMNYSKEVMIDRGAKPKNRQHYHNSQNSDKILSFNERVFLTKTLPESRNYFNERVSDLGSPNLWSSSYVQETLQRGRKLEGNKEHSTRNNEIMLSTELSSNAKLNASANPVAFEYFKRDTTRDEQFKHQLSGEAELGNIHVHGLHNPNASVSNSQILTFDKASDPWKSRQNTPIDREMEIGKTVRGILNKLTAEKFTTLRRQLGHIEIDTEDKMRTIINVIFESAAVNSKYNFLYADICTFLEFKPTSRAKNDSFKDFLINKCRTWYMEDATEKLNANEEKQKLFNGIDEIERRNQRQKGIICFITNLYKSILPDADVLDIIDSLLKKDDEISLECLCCLFVKIGKQLTNRQNFRMEPVPMALVNEYICRMQDIADHQKISPRIKFMLQDVKDLKENGWNPRKTDDQPTDKIRTRKGRFFHLMDQQSNQLGMFDFTDRFSPFSKSSSELFDDADLSKRYLALANSTPVPSFITKEHEQNQNSITHSAKTSDAEIKQTRSGIFKKEVEEQWSPLNPEGKKHYDWEFFLQMQSQPISLKKPTNLPNLEIIKDKAQVYKLCDMNRAPIAPIIPQSLDPFMPQYSRGGASRSAQVYKLCDMNRAPIAPMTPRSFDPFMPQYSRGGAPRPDVEFTFSQTIVKPVTVEVPSATEIKTKLDFYLKNDSQNNEQIFDWIKSHIGANIGEPTFIRALVTAVFENAIFGSLEKCELNTDKLKLRMPLIQHYVAHEGEAKLQTLYALQALILRLNQPKGILNQIFDTLYDEEIICEETFDKWETSQDPAEQEGKDAALNSVNSFLTWLREDEDSESSAEDG